MARLINNQLSGRVGNLVYCISSSGKTYIRQYVPNNPSCTEKQLAMRVKLKAMMGFLNPFRKVINECWHPKKGSKEVPFDTALGRMMKEGFKGKYPNLAVDYSRLQISKGNLDLPVSSAFSVSEGRGIVSWSPETHGSGDSWADDFACFTMFNEQKGLVTIYKDQALRQNLSMGIAIPISFRDDTLHGYLFFRDIDNDQASATQYLPAVRLSAP